MKCKEAEINSVSTKSVNVLLEAQSSELSFWGLTISHLLKRTSKQNKTTLSSCFPLCASVSCPKQVNNQI